MVTFISANDAITPASLGGLEFWVKSDAGITKDGSNNVSAWADQSGNSRDLSEATNQPLWVDATLNGYPVIRFDGTNDKLATADFTVAQPFHCFVVVKILALPATTGMFVSFDNDTNSSAVPNVHSTSGGLFRLQANGLNGAAEATDTTDFHLVEGYFSGTSSTLVQDNGSTNTDVDDLAGSVDGVVLGARFSGLFSNCEIAEVALYNAAITGVDLIKLREYFNNRYNLY